MALSKKRRSSNKTMKRSSSKKGKRTRVKGKRTRVKRKRTRVKRKNKNRVMKGGNKVNYKITCQIKGTNYTLSSHISINEDIDFMSDGRIKLKEKKYNVLEGIIHSKYSNKDYTILGYFVDKNEKDIFVRLLKNNKL